MRILILANNASGLLSFRKEVVEAIIKSNHQVLISVPDDGRLNELEETGAKCLPTPIDRRSTNPIKDFGLILDYRKMIRENNIDLVLSYTIKPNIYGGIAAKLCNVPQIANITGLGTAVENPSVLQKFIFGLYRFGMNKTKCVFFQNDENRQFCLKHGLIKSPTRLIPGSGVNLNRFSPTAYPEDEKIKFLFIGRLMKDKGIDHYFEAAKYIREKYPQTEFHIIGSCEDDYEEQLQTLVNNGIIVFHGQQNDVRPFLNQINCLVHPSYHEGMSNVCLEAAASARPIITTNVPGCKETVDVGKSGLLIRPKDTQDLIEAIEKFLHMTSEDRTIMGMNGRRKVENEFDRQIVIDSYLEEISK